MPPRSSKRSVLPGDNVKGKTTPRLFTPPLRPLTRKTSLGYEVADFAEMIGEPFLPWQKWTVVHALELLPGGGLRFRTVLILVARQNGKSSLKRTVSLWRMYIDGAKLILGTAQDVKQAREQWSYALDTVRGCPDLAAELVQVRNVNGDEWFRISSGGRYMITASNDKAGRGLSVDELNIDELRTQSDWRAWAALSKTTMARTRAQTWCMSNMGGDDAVVLNQLRNVAVAGGDPSLFIAEWSAPDGCELDDWGAIAQANPGLGITVPAAAIRTAMVTDSPEVYRAEVLCQKVDQLNTAVDGPAWKAGTDAAGSLDSLRDRVACCFDIAPDGLHATLCAAAELGTGQVRVEVVQAWKSTEQARDELPELLAKIKPVAVAWYPTGPGAAFAPMLRPRGDSVELTGNKACEACQGLADLVHAGKILHPGDPLLDSHVLGASKKPSADGWRFTRKHGHADAAYAAAGAVLAALTAKPKSMPRIRMLA